MRSWPQLWFVAPYLVIGFLILISYARDLNVLLLGEETAMNLGVNVEQTKRFF